MITFSNYYSALNRNSGEEAVRGIFRITCRYGFRFEYGQSIKLRRIVVNIYFSGFIIDDRFC